MGIYCLRSEIAVLFSIETSYFVSLVLIVLLNRVKLYSLIVRNAFFVFLTHSLSVLMHELSHFIVSLVMLGKPKGLTIIPVKREYETAQSIHTHWEFGNVISTNVNFFNSFYVGLAPLLLIPIAYAVYNSFFIYMDYTSLNIILLHLIVFVVISNAIPSSVDIRLAFSHKVGVLLNIVLLAILYFNFYIIKGMYYETVSFITGNLNF